MTTEKRPPLPLAEIIQAQTKLTVLIDNLVEATVKETYKKKDKPTE